MECKSDNYTTYHLWYVVLESLLKLEFSGGKKKLDKTNITVTMPIAEYEKLQDIEKSFNENIRMFERANVDGKAVMTKELEQRIIEIYC